jgi:hypothetical protein
VDLKHVQVLAVFLIVSPLPFLALPAAAAAAAAAL